MHAWSWRDYEVRMFCVRTVVILFCFTNSEFRVFNIVFLGLWPSKNIFIKSVEIIISNLGIGEWGRTVGGLAKRHHFLLSLFIGGIMPPRLHSITSFFSFYRDLLFPALPKSWLKKDCYDFTECRFLFLFSFFTL